MSSKDEGGAIAPQNKGSWTSFLKSIASFNGDLSSMTAPPFILGTISLVEFSAYWNQHPSVFVAPASEEDPAKRALLVLKWFLSSLKPSYASRSEKLGTEKKPLNPFLGELYLGKWEDETGTTQLVSEQVSHHPPATAYCIWNDKHGVKLEGYNAQKASFSSTIHVKQIGHALYSLPSRNETYLITLPAIQIEGLIYGSPFVELNKSTYISSSTGYVAKIDYSGKGWVSGKKNSFSAKLYPVGKEKDVLYSVDGQWTDAFTIREGGSHKKAGKHDHIIETYDCKTAKSTPLQVAPIDQQDPYESHRAWKAVKEAIIKGDLDTTSIEKSKIENSQRELRKKEQSEGREWERRFFTRVDTHDKIFETLAAPIGERIEADKTGGVWRFDSTKASNSRPPFHDSKPGELK